MQTGSAVKKLQLRKITQLHSKWLSYFPADQQEKPVGLNSDLEVFTPHVQINSLK